MAKRTAKKTANSGVRFDDKRTRLKTGEIQRKNGTYEYRWTTRDGKRHSVYAPTLDKLREYEEQVIVDRHDGIKTDEEQFGRKASGACGRVVGTEPAADTDTDILWF